jgi:hypothetical protein
MKFQSRASTHQTFLWVALAIAGAPLGCSKEQPFRSEATVQPTTANQPEAPVVWSPSGRAEDSNQEGVTESPSDDGEVFNRETTVTLPDVEALILSFPRDRNIFAIKDVDIPRLGCGDTLELDASSSEEEDPSSVASITWLTSDPEVARIDANGQLTITGFGEVAIAAVKTRGDGSRVQDHIRLSVESPQNTFSVSTPRPINPEIIATARLEGTTYTDAVNGKATGVIQLEHPSRNINIQNVRSIEASSDFINFSFGPIEPPAKDPQSCLWFTRFGITFEYLFVKDATNYTKQRISVEFDESTGRSPLEFNWNATLYPNTDTPTANQPIVNTGIGTQGFSPL